jgi:ABC-type phosphate transport system substrate-binding protein
MKILGAAFLMVGVGFTTTASAINNVALQGSDTLEEVTKAVLAQCPGATTNGITYNGGGSTTGENAMTASPPTQFVAPMSRFLNPTTGVCAKGPTAEAIVVGLDGIAIVTSASEGNKCGGGLAFTSTHSFAVTDTNGNAVNNCSGCDSGTNTYHLTDWKDVLTLIYGGKTHAGVTDCNSDVRRSLVNNWGALFEASCTGSTCTQLRHAWRRSDFSGTSDTLLTLLALPGLPSAKTVPGAVAKGVAFCNAFGLGNIFAGDDDYQDKDPIRRPCDNNEEACSRDGTLGLVTVVEVPADLTGAQLFSSVACSPGKFQLMKPATTGITACPNGLGLLFGKCFQPYQDLGGGAFNAHCIALKTPVQGFGANGMNGRAYNLIVKNADGSYVKDNLNRFITGAFYGVHTSKVIATGAATCTQTDSTAQIGCLAQADPCSMGYAGREAANQAGSIALTLNGITDSQANIEKIVTAPSDPTFYPLSRKLFFSTVAGFGDPNLATGELELAKCMSNGSIVNPIITSHGFIDVPGGIFCQDFDERTCVSPAMTYTTNSNACGSNPAGVVPNI